jgi:STE24 endopeptidase
MNVYGTVILTTLLLAWVLQLVGRLLNLRALRPEPPEEVAGACETEDYERSQEYLRVRTRLCIAASIWDLVLLLAFWFAGGFGWLDATLRQLGLPSILTGLLYIGSLVLAKWLADLPWSIYSTFVVEERFGLNCTTVRTFLGDLAKGLALSLLLGGPLLALVLLLFERGGGRAWLLCWIVVSLFTIVLQYLVPTLILPLFYRFTPLEKGRLYETLSEYAERVGFPLAGIFVVDGSRRSTKANAFFTGFGRRKRIALFDTLIDRHTTDELLAVLAHEVGHYKAGHVLQRSVISILHGGVLFFLLGVFLRHRGLFEAFYVEEPSVYVGLVLFGLLCSPIELLLTIASNALSRRHERAADRFAIETTGDGPALAAALRRLAVENLSNLTPHPFWVFLTYSHPPVVERIRAAQA